jgi:hypothetical protein
MEQQRRSMQRKFFISLAILVVTNSSTVAALEPKIEALVKQADDCRQQGQFDQATALYGKAFAQCSDRNTCAAADILRNQARCYIQQGNWKQACDALQHAVFIYELNLRPDVNANRKALLPAYYKVDFHAPECAAVLSEYSTALKRLNKNDEANKADELASRLKRKSEEAASDAEEWKKLLLEVVPDTHHTAWSATADEKFKKLVEFEKKFPRESARMMTTWRAFGNWYFARKKYKEAEQSYALALGIAEKTLGKGNPALGELICQQARVCTAGKEFKKSEELYKNVLAMYSPILPDSDSNMIEVILELQNLYKEQGEADGLKALELKERLSTDATKNASTPKAADQNRSLLSLYLKNGKFEMAERSLKNIIAFEESTEGSASIQDVIALAEVECHLKKYPEAEELFKSAQSRCAKERLRLYDEVLDKYAEMLRECNRTTEAETLEAQARQFRLEGLKKLYH